MKPYYEDGSVTLYHGDCLDVVLELPAASVDAVVTDPPYGLAFMGKKWDYHVDGKRFGAWCELWAAECVRVLKPGGHLLAFGGTRTWHRMACAIEDAGFEVRDSIAWLYGSGFPKSLDVSKAIDKAAGAVREVLGERTYADGAPGRKRNGTDLGVINDDGWKPTDRRTDTAPATPDAARWQGWGTALKPAFEPIVVARKPLAGTVAANVLEHGVGALNIDGCRVGSEERVNPPSGAPGANAYRLTGGDGRDPENARRYAEQSKALPPTVVAGRWPANVTLDEDQAAALDEQSGVTSARRIEKPAAPTPNMRVTYNGADDGSLGGARPARGHTDTGGASRFFYVAKADSTERPRIGHVAHPTVKPLDLMRWLVRLVTPPGGLVLDPFAGSGTTAEACVTEGFRCVVVEREADYLPLIVSRITKPLETVLDFGAAS